MKLFTGIGPNPRAVVISIAELGVDVETETVDLMTGENRQASHLVRNPSGQLPTLLLDDGSFLAEITAIMAGTAAPDLAGASLKGKRILVVGIGNSAADISVELSSRSLQNEVTISTRSSAWIAWVAEERATRSSLRHHPRRPRNAPRHR